MRIADGYESVLLEELIIRRQCALLNRPTVRLIAKLSLWRVLPDLRGRILIGVGYFGL